MRQRLFIILLLFILCCSVKELAAQENIIMTREVRAWDGTLRRVHVPILMYHYVSVPPPAADDIRISLSVEPDFFRTQMQYLRDNNYTPISLYDLHSALMDGTPLPYNPVVLTFDDGYIDHYANVFPILQEYGFTGTFFVITARADENNPNYLSWAQIVEMSNAGMSMESHTKNHLELDERDYDFIVYEVLGSLESLAAHTGRQSYMFCYPAGRYDANALAVLQTLPVWRAVTTQYGTTHTTDNALLMPRVRITHDTSLATFAYLLRGT